MISVTDKMTGSEVKVTVVGRPFQWQHSIDNGKVQYHGKAAQMLESIANELSEKVGINSVALDGSEGWAALVAEEKAVGELMAELAAKMDTLLKDHGAQLATLAGSEVTTNVVEHDGKEYKETIGKTEDGKTIYFLKARGRPQKFTRNDDGSFVPLVAKKSKVNGETVVLDGKTFAPTNLILGSGEPVYHLVTGQRGRPARFIIKDGVATQVK